VQIIQMMIFVKTEMVKVEMDKEVIVPNLVVIKRKLVGMMQLV